MKRVIEKTEDGSATLFVPELNEHYHSVKGARTESQHIFIDMGLKVSAASRPRVLEIGFGTGLNALLTLETAEKEKRHIHYTAIELYPLAWQEVDALKYSDHPLFKTLHEAPWEEEVDITPHFTLHKVQADVASGEWIAESGKRLGVIDERLRVSDKQSGIRGEQSTEGMCSTTGTDHSILNTDCLILNTNHPTLTTNRPSLNTNRSPINYDIVYFDAFAPEKQPEMWEEEIFRKLYAVMNDNGILTTYCSKGVIRRMLQGIGFEVERLPGPPRGKREILRGRKT